MAPEILKERPYDEKVDIWALGVISFMLILGKVPFSMEDDNDMLDDILEGEFDLKRTSYLSHPKATPLATDFLQKCLNRNPTKRWSADKLLAHQWFDQTHIGGLDHI
jgi:serine/threonine protein kinase